MARIIHPRPAMGSQVAFGLTFRDGAVEHDLTDAPVLTQALLQHGFTIEAELDYLADWTKQKLVTYAEEQGIDLGGAKTKPQILAAIEAAALDAIVEPFASVTENPDGSFSAPAGFTGALPDAPGQGGAALLPTD